jgi:uncharacterized membrane protein
MGKKQNISDVSLTKGNRYRFGAPPPKEVKESWMQQHVWLHIFGPRDAASLEVEDQRLQHGMRKAVFLLAFVTLILTAFSLYFTLYEGSGYPEPNYAQYHMAWASYIVRITGGIVVFILVLLMMFRMAAKSGSRELVVNDQGFPVPVTKAAELLSKASGSDPV